jgi:hypothetical protein
MTHTIEQYLIALTGLENAKNDFLLNDEDKAMLTSIARQLTKKIALTDRQYELVKSKLIKYRDQFERNNMNQIDSALETLAYPLREVDRRQTMEITNEWIVIRFPFNKKTKAQLDTLASKYRIFYQHEKGSNEHRFKLYEPIINELVEMFKNKKFDTDPRIFEINNEIESIKNRKNEIVPHVTEHGIFNVDRRATELALKEIGEYTRENRVKYWDRSIRYGYQKEQRNFDLVSSLAEILANRTTVRQYIDPGKFELTAISTALSELNRFPLLISLNRNKELGEIKAYFEMFSGVNSREQILLDRIEDQNSPNFKINSFVKEENFNNWLDKDIKIVYIFKNSLPKLLLKGDWRPITHMSLSSERENPAVANYIEEYCDLNIYYDSQRSYWNNSIQRQLIQWVQN